jgi:hypothetical protein
MTIGVTALVLFCLGAIGLIAWGTIARNRWGLKLGKVNCPRCLRAIPKPDGIAGVWQSFFGGGRCTECKTLVNKWGREIMPSHKDRVASKK